jgi:hypothetical protein
MNSRSEREAKIRERIRTEKKRNEKKEKVQRGVA